VQDAFGQPQSVVVLGGTSDIARAIVRKLCAARAETVVLAGRDEGRLREAAREAEEYGATRTAVVTFEATDPSSARGAVEDALDRVEGPVDLVLVAVGLLGDQAAMEDDPDAAATMVSVNMAWPVAALAAVRARLVAQGHGRIMVITSVAGVRVRRSSYLYAGAKAGLDRLCLGMIDSLVGTGVTMQVVRPGFVRTKMTTGQKEAPFTTGPNEVAQNVMRGLATGRPVIWSPPLLRYVFAVVRLLPPALWRRVADLEAG
jgi:decaprenylphospho-beta-D-erythro-pentofuranosid-2-ulose 2-reductase